MKLELVTPELQKKVVITVSIEEAARLYCVLGSIMGTGDGIRETTQLIFCKLAELHEVIEAKNKYKSSVFSSMMLTSK